MDLFSAIRFALLGVFLTFFNSEPVFAGSNSEPGVVNYSNQTASVGDALKTTPTVLSWLFSFLDKPDVVGPAADSLEIAENFGIGAEKYANALAKIDPALDDALATVVGVGQPVRSQSDLKIVQFYVRETTGTDHVSDFGLSIKQVNKIVEQRIEERGLKAW